MKPVFQEPMDGQCLRAAICSLFEIPMELGPKVQCEGHTWDGEKYVCTIEAHSYVHSKGTEWEKVAYHCDSAIEQDKWVQEWCDQFGLHMAKAYVDAGARREVGLRSHGGYKLLPPGLCIASGLSPRYGGGHVVVWDTRLYDFEHPMGRMVHDPTPDRENIGLKSLEQFYWFEVVDPALLHKLHELRRLEPDTVSVQEVA